MISHAFDGTITVTDDSQPQRAPLILPPGTSPVSRDAQIATYLGPDLSYPDVLSVSQLRLYLTSTGQIATVTAAITALPANLRALANIEISNGNVSVNLAKFIKQALGLNAANFAALLRAAAAFPSPDYGAP